MDYTVGEKPPVDDTQIIDQTQIKDDKDNSTRLRSPSRFSKETVVASEDTAADSIVSGITSGITSEIASEDATRIQNSKASKKTRSDAVTKTDLTQQVTKTKVATEIPSDTFVEDELEPGTRIRDRFVVVNKLGAGGMGAVYQALDLRKQEAGDDDPFIAIKVLRGDFRQHSDAFVTLQREAKKTNALSHPNIVTVYDFDRDGELIYLTMELLKGEPLNEVISGKTDIVLTDKDRLRIIDQIAKGLSYAHAKGLVHSDLKPENIFYMDSGDIKILDFGIARAANTDKYQDSFDAGTLGALTYTYASKEMIERQDPHPSDDIYALGIIAYHLFNDFHPFGRKDALTAFQDRDSPAPFKVGNPILRKVLMHTIELKREDRIQNASVFLKRFHSSRNAPKRLAIITLFGAIAIAVNALYIQTIDVEDIPFDELPAEQQEQFHQLIKEGNLELQFGLLNDAIVLFDRAYAIHQSHNDMTKARRDIEAIIKSEFNSADSKEEYDQAIELRESLSQYEAFKDLSEIKNQPK